MEFCSTPSNHPSNLPGSNRTPKILAGLFIGLKRAFDRHGIETYGQGVEDEWEDRKHEAPFKSATDEWQCGR
ncbi:hypothetical protein E4U46_006327 [Claviceps purpurea]|nr:hypothetical protein E4U46_006327 [Claviceps purpurea]